MQLILVQKGHPMQYTVHGVQCIVNNTFDSTFYFEERF